MKGDEYGGFDPVFKTFPYTLPLGLFENSPKPGNPSSFCGIWVAVGNSSEDKFSIVPADGNHQSLDNDGLIRVAARLENKPQSGECEI